MRRGRGGDPRRRRLRLAPAAAAPCAGSLLAGRAAGAGAPPFRRAARRGDRRLGAARAPDPQQRGAGACRDDDDQLRRALGARARARLAFDAHRRDGGARTRGLTGGTEAGQLHPLLPAPDAGHHEL